MLYDFLTEAMAPHGMAPHEMAPHEMAPRETGSLAGTTAQRSAGKAALEKASQNTLTPADLAPVWRGPPARKYAKHAV